MEESWEGKIKKVNQIEGKVVKELAEEIYASMDPDFVVSAAAAVWISTPVKGNNLKGRWELSVKNKG